MKCYKKTASISELTVMLLLIAAPRRFDEVDDGGSRRRNRLKPIERRDHMEATCQPGIHWRSRMQAAAAA
ncbi:hypothetical protein MTO96_024072 [Rhipicephalus appendiculatus]